MEQVLTLLSKIRTQRRKIARMGKSPNGKRSRKTSSRTRRKRWKWRKNQCKRAHHPNARFLERWLPSISNDLRRVPSHRWSVLTVEERIRFPSQGRPPVPSARPTQNADRSSWQALVG